MSVIFCALKAPKFFAFSTETPLMQATRNMRDQQIASIVVVSHESNVGLLAFREIISAHVKYSDNWS